MRRANVTPVNEPVCDVRQDASGRCAAGANPPNSKGSALNCRWSDVVASTPARWRIVAAVFLLALMRGLSYVWGVVVLPVMERFGWTKTQATLPFTTFMLVFAAANSV